MDEELLKRNIARRIRIARTELGWKQYHLAEQLGTDQKAISKLESGGVDLRATTLNRLVQVLGKPIEWFFEPVPALVREQQEIYRVVPEAEPKKDGRQRQAKKRKAA